MLTVHSNSHRLHDAAVELHRGQLLPCFETPRRIEIILEHLSQVALGDIVPPRDFGLLPIQRIHDASYLQFLQQAHNEWRAAGACNDAIPHAWIGRRMRTQLPTNIFGKLGYYASDAGTPITETTWQAVAGSAQIALTAQEHVSNTSTSAFGLTRPPGHHASTDEFGGYCFLNNSAIAAQAFLDKGARRVAIIDIDFHHGNGTQSIFYDRNDVFFASIHGDPKDEYPYFLGDASEQGERDGEGFNLNCPLPPGTGWRTYQTTLVKTLTAISDFGPDYLVVSLGVDTFKDDPISRFRLDSPDFISIGSELAGLDLPTLFLMEGGYAIRELGVNVGNVLHGFESVT